MSIYLLNRRLARLIIINQTVIIAKINFIMRHHTHSYLNHQSLCFYISLLSKLQNGTWQTPKILKVTRAFTLR